MRILNIRSLSQQNSNSFIEKKELRHRCLGSFCCVGKCRFREREPVKKRQKKKEPDASDSFKALSEDDHRNS